MDLVNGRQAPMCPQILHVREETIITTRGPGEMQGSEGADVAKSTYTQQHTLDVGDIPGHQIRIHEVHRTYPNDKPNCGSLTHRVIGQRLFQLHRLEWPNYLIRCSGARKR